MWQAYKKGFKAYLQLERSLSENSVEAYLHDIEKLTTYLQQAEIAKAPKEIVLKDLEKFIRWISELGMMPGSQARIISGLKSFFKYCLQEQIITIDPTALLEAPKLKRALPDILSFEEIEAIINAINLSTPEGGRNKAMLETLYATGLRVSELVLWRASQRSAIHAAAWCIVGVPPELRVVRKNRNLARCLAQAMMPDVILQLQR